MGELGNRSTKPLQINPIKLSSPMGATLAFLGVDRCMPLMHGAQGCTSFTKVFFTRHFCEPIAIQTSAVTDVTAVLDGGDYNIVESIKNITKKAKPDLIGLFTTGLTETKGDDVRGIASQIAYPLVHVNTPDYEAGLENGWALATKALISQLVESATHIDPRKVVICPHVGLQAIEVEKIKEFISLFGFEVHALPDLSTALDGHLGEKQSALSSGGITLATIKALGDAGTVISIGTSMLACAAGLQAKNPKMQHVHFDHLNGLEATDDFVATLLDLSGQKTPHATIVRWRQRLQDAMLDSHFTLGQTNLLITGEPDQAAGLCQALGEAGGRIKGVIASGPSAQLARIKAEKVVVGDLDDAETMLANCDLLIGNSHCEALAHLRQKPLLLRGFPNWEQIGHQLTNDVLYEGGCYLLFAAANAISRAHMEPVTHGESPPKSTSTVAEET
jgi:nitrogenase molybdenum-iron protein NifN